MAIEECPHCFTSVIFNNTSLCPCCGKDKNCASHLTKSQYEAEKEDEEKRIICNSLLKRARACLIIGGTLLFVFFISTALSCLAGVASSIYITGFIASLVILARGIKDIMERNKLKKAIRRDL